MKKFDPTAKDPAAFFDDPHLQENPLAMKGVDRQIVGDYSALARWEHYAELVEALKTEVDKKPDPKKLLAKLRTKAFWGSAVERIKDAKHLSTRAKRVTRFYREMSEKIKEDPTFDTLLKSLDKIYTAAIISCNKYAILPDRPIDSFEFSPLIDNKKAYYALRARAQADIEKYQDIYRAKIKYSGEPKLESES